VLRETVGPEREEVTGGWIKLYSEQLHDLYLSLNVIRFIKLGSSRWVGHVACVAENKNGTNNFDRET